MVMKSGWMWWGSCVGYERLWKFVKMAVIYEVMVFEEVVIVVCVHALSPGN